MVAEPTDRSLQRRRFLTCFSASGLSATLLPGVLWARMQELPASRITRDMLLEAEAIAGLSLTEADRALILERVNANVDDIAALRRVPLANDVLPALRFTPVLPGMAIEPPHPPAPLRNPGPIARPARLDDVAFWPVWRLADLVRSRQVRAIELAEMYLARLRQYDRMLLCVVTLTEDLARRQAETCDADLARGVYRGPLHGIPWGVKDLVATKKYPTTWGSALYRDRVIDEDATLVGRLEAAGAVLVAKLSTGELAYDDVWSDGTAEYQTRNPWDVAQGASGSSAGPAAAVAAGLVGFAIGTETGGSIIEPAMRCGATGLRPTFGRVSRHGVMTVAWSFDKVGPLCRTVEDCALVLQAIAGPDGKDPTVIDVPFAWDGRPPTTPVRVGYLQAAFEEPRAIPQARANDEATMRTLRDLGYDLRAIEVPTLPIEAAFLNCWLPEIGAVLDELFRLRKDAAMTAHARRAIAWACQAARFVPAVEHVQATRVRTRIMEAMARLMSEVDVYVAPVSDPLPPVSNRNVQLTNLTGQPAIVMPNGLTPRGTPTAVTFVGRVLGEGSLLAVAKAYQDAAGFHLLHPRL